MTNPELTLEKAVDLVGNLKKNIEASVFGQEELITETLCCLLSGGHILMTGAPGLAKTTLVRIFSKYLGLKFSRIQFTPDLLPSDIIGSEVLNINPNTGSRSFDFTQGPVFTNLLLADEINRASPRTQSALLEAMQERTCTVAGKVHQLPAPFMVFATQNPFESEGTFPLPEAQLDRFLVHTLVDYPSLQAEEQILRAHSQGNLVGEQRGDLGPGNFEIDAGAVEQLIRKVNSVAVEDQILKVIAELVRSTRPIDEHCPTDMRESIWYGAGPRAGISLISLSRSAALLDGSEVVRWQHVKKMTKPTLRHRIRITAQAGRDRMTEDQVIEELIERLENRHKFLAKGVT